MTTGSVASSTTLQNTMEHVIAFRRGRKPGESIKAGTWGDKEFASREFAHSVESR
jgi:hypothetical protein